MFVSNVATLDIGFAVKYLYREHTHHRVMRAFALPRLSEDLRTSQVAVEKEWPRKSFSTYDSALSGSLKITAKSAGNSPEMLQRYYNKPTSQTGLDALDWFSISPKDYKGLVEKHVEHLKLSPQKKLGSALRKVKPRSSKPRRSLLPV